MDRKANQEKALAAYREKQKRVAALLARIQDKLAKHADPVVCWGHVGRSRARGRAAQPDRYLFELIHHQTHRRKIMTEHSFEQTAKDFIEHLRQAGKKEGTLYTYAKDLEKAGAFFGKDKPIAYIQSFSVGKFFKSDALLKLADGSDRAERTVAKTIRVFRIMMIWAKETGRIETLPLPKSTPMGHSKIKAENDEQKE